MKAVSLFGSASVITNFYRIINDLQRNAFSLSFGPWCFLGNNAASVYKL